MGFSATTIAFPPRMKKARQPFWQGRALHELSRREWERLCDGCALCCQHKLEDARTGWIQYTGVACRLLDLETCRCRRYRDRRRLVPACAILEAATIREHCVWLPPTCAYRRLAEGQALPAWHPLVTGDPHSTRKAGMSARGRLMTEAEAACLGKGVARARSGGNAAVRRRTDRTKAG
jgi:uncharacterized protein